MRIAFTEQQAFGTVPIRNIQFNFGCRDEMIPILVALQHVYSQPALREQILALVRADVNRDSRDDCGREGLSYWQVLVLAAVRLGCDLDYDRLQDLAEQHRSLRLMMQISDWDERHDFGFRRIRDNLCLLSPETIERISQLIVGEGHRLVPEAVTTTRADSFVVETCIHYPTESSLIHDGLRKVIELAVPQAEAFGVDGWRQHSHLLKRVKKAAREVGRIASRQGKNYKARLKKSYEKLLSLARKITSRAQDLFDLITLKKMSVSTRAADMKVFLDRTRQVMDTARRRVIEGETVPNSDKLFSIFEPHTQLHKRGKAGEPVQFGRLVMVYEDGAGFITHHHLLPRDASDRDVIIAQTKAVQERLGGRIKRGSFDRGFHSPENQQELGEILSHPCLPKPGAKQSAKQHAEASAEFRAARRSHPGIESAIGALQSGNGQKRCRDRSEVGFARYISLGILGRNLHTLGRLLISQTAPQSEAARSLRL